MEIIIDCPKCGASELFPISEAWKQDGGVLSSSFTCKQCNIICRAELIPFETSIKLFVVAVDEENKRIPV